MSSFLARGSEALKGEQYKATVRITELHFSRSPHIPSWLPAALTAAVAWFAVFRILWTDWTIDPQYSYGLLVPILALGLLLKLWEDRPDPLPPGPLQGLCIRICLFGAALLIVAMIPMAEANPDWRPLGGAASLAAVILSLCMIAMAGGVPWLKYFAFPVCFFLIAVPWPRNFEQGVIFPLMAWNTSATLEVLHWMGVEAMSQGNLIVLPSGILGIEEACSGIRSLQSGLMEALFFGEYFCLSWGRRFALLGIAVVAALAGNICRSSLLAIVASSRGLEAVSLWHDRAGLLVFGITFAAVLGFAVRWRKSRAAVSSPERKGAPIFCSGHAKPVLMAVFTLLMSSLILTELWFASHERGGVRLWSWDIHPRQGAKGVVAVPMSSGTLRMLFYPEGFSEKWIAGPGEQGQVFYFEWPPGRMAAQAVSMHNPEVCLSNIGLVMKSPLLPAVFSVGEEQIPFNCWLFDDRGSPVYVFHALLEQGADAGSGKILKDSPSGRLRALLSGHRNHGQRMVEVALWNLPSYQAARLALSQYLHDSVEILHPLKSAHP